MALSKGTFLRAGLLLFAILIFPTRSTAEETVTIIETVTVKETTIVQHTVTASIQEQGSYLETPPAIPPPTPSISDSATNRCPGVGEDPSGRCNLSFFKSAAPNLNLEIEKASLVGPSSCFGEGPINLGQPLYAYNQRFDTCAVIARRGTYRFGMLMPVKEQWRGKFLMVGNGGFTGGINWVEMTQGPILGMVSVSTDTGHNSSATMEWAKDNVEAQEDWGYRTVHGTMEAAKALTEKYYDSEIEYSYYMGCSTGGRQGLREIQEDQGAFDGLLIGAPAWQVTHLMPTLMQQAVYNLPEDSLGRLQEPQWKTLTKFARQVCDGRDGLAGDNIISVDSCTIEREEFTTGVLCGAPGVDPDSCLTEEQIDVALQVYSGYHLSTGEEIMPGPVPGGEADWVLWLAGNLAQDYDQQWAKYFLWTQEDWDYKNFSDTVFYESVLRNPGKASADRYDISDFKDGGGKILMYHGIADGLLPVGAATRYYESTKAAVGGADMDDWFRYFQIPGMHHCVSTPLLDDARAPWFINGAFQQAALFSRGHLLGHGVPGHINEPDAAEYDALQALMAWVEKGRPVDAIIATEWNDDPNGLGITTVNRTRPVCPYPKRARLVNPKDLDQDPDDAASWMCA
jgi:feruloyl esterase